MQKFFFLFALLFAPAALLAQDAPRLDVGVWDFAGGPPLTMTAEFLFEEDCVEVYLIFISNEDDEVIEISVAYQCADEVLVDDGSDFPETWTWGEVDTPFEEVDTGWQTGEMGRGWYQFPGDP